MFTYVPRETSKGVEAAAGSLFTPTPGTFWEAELLFCAFPRDRVTMWPTFGFLGLWFLGAQCQWNSHISFQRKTGLHLERLSFYNEDALARRHPEITHFPTMIVKRVIFLRGGLATPLLQLTVPWGLLGHSHPLKYSPTSPAWWFSLLSPWAATSFFFPL